MGLSKTILHTRELRRKILFQLLIFLLIIVVLGAWPLAGFLGKHVWLFVIWWFGCVFYTLLVILLAIYDMLMVMKGR